MIRSKPLPSQDAPLYAAAGVPLPKSDKQVKVAVLRLTGRPLRSYETTVVSP